MNYMNEHEYLQRTMSPERYPFQRKCVTCGVLFGTHDETQKQCHEDCPKLAEFRRIMLEEISSGVCPICGKKFYCDPLNPNPKKYCSIPCRSKAHRLENGQKYDKPGRPVGTTKKRQSEETNSQ